LNATVAENKTAATVQLSMPTQMEIKKGVSILGATFDVSKGEIGKKKRVQEKIRNMFNENFFFLKL